MATPTTQLDDSIEIGAERQWTPLPANYYTATLVGIEKRARAADKFHDAPYTDIEMTWDMALDAETREIMELADGEAFTRRSWANLPKTVTEKAKLVQIGVALGVLDLAAAREQGVQIQLRAWIGRKCRVNVENKTDADGTIRDTIAGYAALPVRKPAQSAKPAPRPAPVPDESGDEPF